MLFKPINLILAALIVGLIFFWQQQPDDRLRLVFCDVGQGDATLIIWRSVQVLVDGGPNNRVLECLGDNLPFYDRRLELVIASHAEADHISGLIEVVQRYEVDRFLAAKEVNDTAEYRALADALLAKSVTVQELTAGSLVKFGPLTLKWLWPEQSGGDELAWSPAGVGEVLGAKTSLNEFSQVIQGSFGEFDWLLTGDIDASVEKKLIARVVSEVELLKIAHHGSKYSTSAKWLEKIRPDLAVIEVGKNNYGHPTTAVLDRLAAVGAKVMRTDLDHTVVVESDGRKWWVN